MKHISYKYMKVNPDLPRVSSFSSKWSQAELKERIEESGECIVYVEPETKTSLHIQVICGGMSLSVGIPDDSYKMLERSEYNYFTGRSTTRHFFKVTKKQGLSSLNSYLTHIVFWGALNIKREHLKVTVRFYHTENMSIDIAANVPQKG